MADPAFDNEDDRFNGEMAVAHADFEDFGFDPDSDDNFESHKQSFKSDFSTMYTDSSGQSREQEFDTSQAKHSSARSAANDDAEEILDADFEDDEPVAASRDAGGDEDEVDLYLKQIDKWKSGTEFVNDADAVDHVRAERLKLAAAIDAKPHLIADTRLGEDASYLKSDLIYLSRSDATSDEYGDFIQKRAELRDRMFQGTPVLSADDYVKVAGRAQGMIAQEKFINDQYDMIDLRREASLEHFDDPRFIAEIYRHPRGMMDELLVDFDRRDLLSMDNVTKARSGALASVYSESVTKCADKNQTPAEMVQNFQAMRETGLHIRHNQRAIAGFVDTFNAQTPEGERAYEIGMSGLDNERFGEGMWEDYTKGFSKEDKKFIIKHKGPSASFVKARERFEREMLEGDPHASKSFAVLEHAAAKINKSPKLQAQLAEIGGVNDVAALHVFGKEYKKTLGQIGEKVDKSVVEKMGDDAISADDVERRGSVDQESETGETYNLKVSKNTSFEVVDGAHVRMANTAEELKAGKGIVFRLDGIVAPPEGVSTRSGKIDAGIESKSNLEEVINRHGVESVGISINQLESGENVVSMRTKDGENVSQRMLRDGYAIPTKDCDQADRREAMTKQAEGNGRGLWGEGFPEMDKSWRREKNAPEMTWKDKRQNLGRNVNDALCTTKLHVARNLSRTETKLFALPLKSWSDSKVIDQEISKIANKNPTRIMDIYDNNMEVLDDLRKRKDKLSQPEKVAHDKLAMGRRALGEVLVAKNLLDPQKFKKDSHPFMSRSGLKMSTDGIRALADATATVADKTIETTKRGAKGAKKGALWMLDEAMG